MYKYTLLYKGLGMPGELGNEEEQSEVGYYEHRYGPDEDPSTEPKGTIGDMVKKPSGESVMRVLRKYTEDRMKSERGSEGL